MSEYDRAIEQLYRDMYEPMCTYAKNALKNKDLAEEAVQDTFQIAYSKLQKVFAYGNPEGWLMTTLKYVIKNMRRRQTSLNNLLFRIACRASAVTESPEDEICFDDLCRKILGDEDHKLIKRVVDDKYTMLEAAEEFGITVHACKKRVQRAKAKLKAYLEKEKIIVPKSRAGDISFVEGGKYGAKK